jgi:hypothetical protein
MSETRMDPNLRLVGFDGDDTLWRSEDYYRGAQDEFERIVARHVDLHDARAQERLYAVEKRNLALFGYGVKGMVLSMIEACGGNHRRPHPGYRPASHRRVGQGPAAASR